MQYLVISTVYFVFLEYFLKNGHCVSEFGVEQRFPLKNLSSEEILKQIQGIAASKSK